MYFVNCIDGKMNLLFVHLEQLQKEVENTDLSQTTIEACRLRSAQHSSRIKCRANSWNL